MFIAYFSFKRVTMIVFSFCVNDIVHYIYI